MASDAEHPAKFSDGDLVPPQDTARPGVIACHAYYGNTAVNRSWGAQPGGSETVQTVPSVMVAAVALRAKLCGLLVEKSAPPLSALESASTELLLAMLEEFKRRIAARELTHASHS